MSYGIANVSGQVSRDEAKAILDLASANGIDAIDTAIAYGESEACLGAAEIGNFRVVTKLPPVPEHIADIGGWIDHQVEASLKRLQIDTVYAVILHRSGQFGDKFVRMSLDRLKERGTVRKIGVSIYSPDELDAIPVAGAIDIVQAPLNLVDLRLVTSGWLRRLKDCSIEVHTRSAFLQGLLLMPRMSIPERFSPWCRTWDAWNDWLSGKGISAVQACLGFALSYPEVDRVVVGVETVSQLSQLISVARSPLDIDFLDISNTDERLINPSLWSSL
uniref:Aldo/keto reductase n=1 Tax=uncultured organism MedDCM-OCT-S11-C293 TaxID=743659 RepID=D6PLD5_9ZZZZ|nr:aldo/keto reductase [uncultured organism MedDCM-OCT-S11-C293]